MKVTSNSFKEKNKKIFKFHVNNSSYFEMSTTLDKRRALKLRN